MLRFVPFAVSEFGSLAPHAEAFLVELAKASHAHIGKKIGQLLSAWRRRFSLLINMAHEDNVLGGVAAARAKCALEGDRRAYQPYSRRWQRVLPALNILFVAFFQAICEKQHVPGQIMLL
eukprot:jgi/Tetstr1/460523/TSEL_005782.t1